MYVSVYRNHSSRLTTPKATEGRARVASASGAGGLPVAVAVACACPGTFYVIALPTLPPSYKEKNEGEESKMNNCTHRTSPHIDS